jgi:hypothetical protein
MFGKSKAAIELENILCDDTYLHAKVCSHMQCYFEYVKEISKLSNRNVRNMALQSGLECDLAVSDEVKGFIRNVKIAKLRNVMNEPIVQ